MEVLKVKVLVQVVVPGLQGLLVNKAVAPPVLPIRDSVIGSPVPLVVVTVMLLPGSVEPLTKLMFIGELTVKLNKAGWVKFTLFDLASLGVPKG